MACVIAAPSSGSGKTLLSLLLSSWARSKGISIQPFKVGPDYLDPQQLTLVSKKQCRNLDLILCGTEWVEKSFYRHAPLAKLTLIEGVMGLFDGLGSSHKGSTAHISKLLNLPVVLIVDAKGQAASIAALVKGFKELDDQLEIAGVVLNNVNTDRHKHLLSQALMTINVNVLGCLPTSKELNLPSKYLGLIPAHEIENIEGRVKDWASIAIKHLDIRIFEKLLKSPITQNKINPNQKIKSSSDRRNRTVNIAIAQDNAFHFRYPETKEYLENAGINLIDWKIINDSPIPKEAQGLILPGGYPEQFADQISQSKSSLSSIRSFFGVKPIYAECGGMLIMGESLKDINGKDYPMANLLPFKAEEGRLSVGYRKIKSLRKSLVLEKGEELVGHEFHKWQIRKTNGVEELDMFNKKNFIKDNNNLYTPWETSGWGVNSSKEGWSNKVFHASWIHLHWPSSPNIINNWLKSFTNIR